MFDLKRPCVNCPFRIGQGELFRLAPDRLREIIHAPSFQCHKTVEYFYDDDGGEFTEAGPSPQQCAGLMALLHAEHMPNQIMQVAERLGHFDPSRVDGTDAYKSFTEAMEAHMNPRDQFDMWLDDRFPDVHHGGSLYDMLFVTWTAGRTSIQGARVREAAQDLLDLRPRARDVRDPGSYMPAPLHPNPPRRSSPPPTHARMQPPRRRA